MAKKNVDKVFNAFAGPIPKQLASLGSVIPSDFGGFIKLNAEDRMDKFFFGVLLDTPAKRKVKGFRKPPFIAKFTELEAETGEALGDIELLCSADLEGKLKKCKPQDTLCIYYQGEQEIGKGNPMLLFQVIKLSKKFTGLASIGLENKVSS